MKKWLFLLLILLIGGGVVGFYWDSTAPSIEVTGGPAVGPETRLAVRLADQGRGLQSYQISIMQGAREQVLVSEDYPRAWRPWEQGKGSSEWSLEGGLPENCQIEEGPFSLRVRASDQPNLFFFSRETRVDRPMQFDATPPRIEVVSQQHYLNQGGSEALLYRVREEGVRSGVQVGEQEFKGYPLSDGNYVCLFALSHDESPETPIFAWAEDAAGNRSRMNFFCKVFPRKFRSRSIQISDRFIASVAPEILSQTPGLEQPESSLETFLLINQELRKRNNRQISDLTQHSQAEPLWEEPFLQLSNSQVEAVFADRRTYYYDGEAVDEQTHLGFDLASLAKSEVEASNRGEVVYADYLGIYGNTVILDHGLGLFSLYGHLSSIEVGPGEIVERGGTLGRTGQTGLAGGDHLHFSMLLQGVQINPIEWWDPSWVELRILSKIDSTEVATR